MPTVSYLTNGKNSAERKLEVEKEGILFDSLDDQGLTLPHGCLAGSCGACKIEITEGAENLKPPSLIETDTINAIISNWEKVNKTTFDRNRELRLSCRAKVRGDISFKVFN